MQIVGMILIVAILVLYGVWIRHTMRRTGVHAKEEEGVQTFDILVKGVYAPSVLEVAVGAPVLLRFRREESTECSRFVNIPDLGVRKELPENTTVEIEFTPSKKGEMVFTCDMSMYQGRIIVK